MGYLRTTRRNADGVIGILPPEPYIHPQLGLCSLYLVREDGVTYWIKWLVTNDDKIMKARSIPIVVNPMMEAGSVRTGTYYAIPVSWNDVYLYVYSTSIIPSNYVTIINVGSLQTSDEIIINKVPPDTGSGTGTGTGSGTGTGTGTGTTTTTNTLFSTKNILIAVGIGFLVLLFANKK